MLKTIKIYNRFAMDDFVLTGGFNFSFLYWYLISIYEDEDKAFVTSKTIQIIKNMGCKDFLSLRFWDITDKEFPNIKKNYMDAVLFDKVMARKIIKFLDKIQKDKEDSVLVVHCNAGISRSGAVGTFVCDYCGLDYNSFLKNNPYIMANFFVLRILRNVAKIQPIKSHDGIDHNFNKGKEKK